MPRFSDIDVSDEQVDQWYTDHGFTASETVLGQRSNPMHTPMSQ
jgi:hypothetical protein